MPFEKMISENAWASWQLWAAAYDHGSAVLSCLGLQL